MTTPADLAADAARRARKTARRQGIMLGQYVEPADTPSTHLIRLQREAALAQAEVDQADQEQAAAEEQQQDEKAAAPKRRRSSKAAS